MYSVVTATNLASPWTLVSQPVYTNIPGTGQRLWFTNTATPDSSRFFRVKVRRQ